MLVTILSVVCFGCVAKEQQKEQHTFDTAEAKHLEYLFKRTCRGDEAAFREFYALVSRRLLAYCMAFTRHRQTAEDMYQSTMLAVYENRKRFVSGSLLGWIFVIARNTGRTMEQKVKSYENIDDYTNTLRDEQAYLDSAEVQDIRSAVFALPDEYRTSIVLYYYGAMSVREIADAEGISQSLVKIRLFRGRQMLAQKLNVYMESDYEKH